MKKNGFTIIELVITVIIIGILSLSSIPIYNKQIKKAEELKIKSELHYIIEITNNFIDDIKNEKVKFGVEEFRYSYNTKKHYIIRKEFIKNYFDNYLVLENNEDLFINISVNWKKSTDLSTYEFLIYDIFFIKNKNDVIRYYNNEFIDYQNNDNKKEFEEVFNYLKNYTLYDRYKII